MKFPPNFCCILIITGTRRPVCSICSVFFDMQWLFDEWRLNCSLKAFVQSSSWKLDRLHIFFKYTHLRKFVNKSVHSFRDNFQNTVKFVTSKLDFKLRNFFTILHLNSHPTFWNLSPKYITQFVLSQRKCYTWPIQNGMGLYVFTILLMAPYHELRSEGAFPLKCPLYINTSIHKYILVTYV